MRIAEVARSAFARFSWLVFGGAFLVASGCAERRGARVPGPEAPSVKAPESLPPGERGRARGAQEPEPARSTAKNDGTVRDQRSCHDGSLEHAPFSFSRALEVSVVSFAVGKPPRAAALTADTTWLFDGERWQEWPLDTTASGDFRAAIFFGRDNRPRLMGTLAGRSYYRRLTATGWRRAAEELGSLGRGRELYGVLGHDDPEVVCEPGMSCIVKRLSGWKTMPAHAHPVPIVAAADTAFALHPDRVRRLVDDAWEELQSPAAFDRPSALSVAPDGAVWVVEGGSGRLYRMNDGTSTHVPHPVGTGRAVWVGRDAVWLAGSGGAASFDGAVWRCAHGVEAVLDFVAGVESTIWLAGSSGVYRGEPAAPRAPASTRSPAD